MLIIISPAKTLDFDTPASTSLHSQPDFLEHSKSLIDVLLSYAPDQIAKLMKISPKLADLNIERYQAWSTPFTQNNAKQAMLAFKGDVYTGLQAETFDEGDLQYSQQALRILSGLYGLLRPLDLMQAYRLEMGTKLPTSKGKNLYEFWDEKITHAINQQLTDINSDILLNLASNEYFKSVNTTEIKADIVTPVFRDWKNGQYKMISFYAKKARGLMSAWVIKNRVTELRHLSQFDIDGYQFSANDSDALNPVFLRKQS